MRRTVASAACVAILLGAPSLWAQDDDTADTVEALRREVSSLKIDLESIRMALSELSDLDRKRSQILRRLLDSRASSPPRRARASRKARAPEPRGRRATPRTADRSRGRPAEEAPGLPGARPGPPAAARTPEAAPPKAPARVASRRAAPSRSQGVVQGRVTMPAGEPVAYVFVENIRARAVKGRKVVIKQRGKNFVPGWAVIQRGTEVEFPNLDAIYHNVFSLSRGNTFDLGLYRSGDASKSYRFMKAGLVDLYCNIHPRMAAAVLVLPNGYFTKVGSDGRFRLEGVPSGKRKIIAWAPGSSAVERWTNVSGQVATLDFELKKRSFSHKNKFNKRYGSY